MILSGNAKVAGVMGWPVSHSLSPMLHSYWLREYGIDGAYIPFSVSPKNLDICLRTLPKLGVSGLNITVPHKENAFRVCHTVDDIARRIGAVNTISIGEDGNLSGSNTDAYGFLENLRLESKWQPQSGPVLVLGAGGAARAVVAALLNAGVSEVRIVNRTFKRAEALAQDFGPPCCAVSWDNIADAMPGIGLLVNTTTLGMNGQPPLEITLCKLPVSTIVNDIVYSPLETDLLFQASQRGNPVVDGLGMLLHQARPGFAAWFGREPKVTLRLRKQMIKALLK